MLEGLFYISLGFLALGILLPMVFNQAGTRIRKLALGSIAISNLLLLAFSAFIVYYNQPTNQIIFAISNYLQYSFFIDRLSAFFLAIIAIISFSVTLYSLSYIEHYPQNIRKNLLVSLMALFILSMMLVVASFNTFTFLFFWEIMSLSSFFLVLFEYEKKETKKAAIFYFIMTQLSTVFLLFAFMIMYHLTGSFDIQAIKNISPLFLTILFLALFCGFGIKAGMVPFHKWLPYAHPASPSNISALMSGIMIKVAIYGLIRFVLFVLGPAHLWWGILILIAGSVSGLLGVLYALKEHNIKRLLAYHSIENIGIILIGFGLYLIFESYGFHNLALLGLAASLFHTVNHAIFKSLLFLTAGSIVKETGTNNIEEMGGLIKKMPYTAVLFLIGAISISALPPFNGFVSELMIFQAFIQSLAILNPFMKIFMVAMLAVFALTSALTAACFAKAFGIIFLAQPRSKKTENAKEAQFSMIFGSAILAVLCIFLGLFSYQLFEMLGYAFPIPNFLIMGIVLLVPFAIIIALMPHIGSKRKRVSETWGCGIISQNSKMEYTASGFSQPILNIFSPAYGIRADISKKFLDGAQSKVKEVTVNISSAKLFESYLYEPIVNAMGFISSKVSSLQNGNLDAYLAYVFVTILFVLLVMGWAL